MERVDAVGLLQDMSMAVVCSCLTKLSRFVIGVASGMWRGERALNAEDGGAVEGVEWRCFTDGD